MSASKKPLIDKIKGFLSDESKYLIRRVGVKRRKTIHSFNALRQKTERVTFSADLAPP